MADASENGRLLPVTQAAEHLGMSRRSLGRYLELGRLPTAAWEPSQGGRRRLVDVKALDRLLGPERRPARANGAPPDARASRGRATADKRSSLDLEAVLGRLVAELGAQLEERGLTRLNEAVALAEKIAKDLSDTAEERSSLARRQRELVDQRKALETATAEHQAARKAYLVREREMTQQLAQLGRRREPRPGEARFTS